MPILYAPDGMPVEVPNTEIAAFVRRGFRSSNPLVPTSTKSEIENSAVSDRPIVTDSLLQSNLLNVNSCSLKDITTSLKLSTAIARKIIDNRPYQNVEDLIAKVELPKDSDWLALNHKLTYAS